MVTHGELHPKLCTLICRPDGKKTRGIQMNTLSTSFTFILSIIFSRLWEAVKKYACCENSFCFNAFTSWWKKLSSLHSKMLRKKEKVFAANTDSLQTHNHVFFFFLELSKEGKSFHSLFKLFKPTRKHEKENNISDCKEIINK